MLKDLRELIIKLKENEKVIGIVRYGGREVDDMSEGGDFDLFVFLKEELYDIESIHFYLAGIPVDMNLRTLADLEKNEPVNFMDMSLLEGEILYDKSGQLKDKLNKLATYREHKSRGLTEGEINFERFSQKHLLDKVKGRMDSRPLLCNLLLHTNIFWLINNYFRLREIKFPGEKRHLPI